MSPMEDMKRSKPRKPRAPSSTRNEFRGFVNYHLTDSEREQLPAYYDYLDETGEAVNDILVAGYKLSISYDDAHDCVIATATGQHDKGHSNGGLAMSSRGPEWLYTVYTLHFKIFRALSTRDWGDLLKQAASAQTTYD